MGRNWGVAFFFSNRFCIMLNTADTAAHVETNAEKNKL